jgi:hypothetical protein
MANPCSLADDAEKHCCQQRQIRCRRPFNGPSHCARPSAALLRVSRFHQRLGEPCPRKRPRMKKHEIDHASASSTGFKRRELLSVGSSARGETCTHPAGSPLTNAMRPGGGPCSTRRLKRALFFAPFRCPKLAREMRQYMHQHPPHPLRPITISNWGQSSGVSGLISMLDDHMGRTVAPHSPLGSKGVGRSAWGGCHSQLADRARLSNATLICCGVSFLPGNHLSRNARSSGDSCRTVATLGFGMGVGGVKSEKACTAKFVDCCQRCCQRAFSVNC